MCRHALDTPLISAIKKLRVRHACNLDTCSPHTYIYIYIIPKTDSLSHTHTAHGLLNSPRPQRCLLPSKTETRTAENVINVRQYGIFSFTVYWCQTLCIVHSQSPHANRRQNGVPCPFLRSSQWRMEANTWLQKLQKPFFFLLILSFHKEYMFVTLQFWTASHKQFSVLTEYYRYFLKFYYVKGKKKVDSS